MNALSVLNRHWHWIIMFNLGVHQESRPRSCHTHTLLSTDTNELAMSKLNRSVKLSINLCFGEKYFYLKKLKINLRISTEPGMFGFRSEELILGKKSTCGCECGFLVSRLNLWAGASVDKIAETPNSIRHLSGGAVTRFALKQIQASFRCCHRLKLRLWWMKQVEICFSRGDSKLPLKVHWCSDVFIY